MRDEIAIFIPHALNEMRTITMEDMMKTAAQRIAEEWKDYHTEAKAIGAIPDDTEETEIEDLAKILNGDYMFARNCGQELAKYGLVTYIKGSKGWKSRVRWNHTPSAISKLLLGKPASLDEIYGPRMEGSKADSVRFRGEKVWNLDQILSLISEVAAVDKGDVVINLKIPEVKAILARAQGIAVDEVSVRMG